MRLPSWSLPYLEKIVSLYRKTGRSHNGHSPRETVENTGFNVKFVNPDYDSSRLGRSISKILGASHLCSMATIGKDHACHINTAFFGFDEELMISFVSDPTTQHCRNLVDSPSMAMTVFDSHQPWGSALSGLQLFGHGFLASGAEEKRASDLYKRRFPLYEEYLATLSPQERELLPFRFFIFRPDSVKILDEDEFGEETFVLTTVQRGI
jgi:uncharacterized protein YhbP (UPF0306 family)